MDRDKGNYSFIMQVMHHKFMCFQRLIGKITCTTRFLAQIAIHDRIIERVVVISLPDDYQQCTLFFSQMKMGRMGYSCYI